MTTAADIKRAMKEEGTEGEAHLFVEVRGNRQIAKPCEILRAIEHVTKLNMTAKGSYGAWRAQVDEQLEFAGLVRHAKLREEVDLEAQRRYAVNAAKAAKK